VSFSRVIAFLKTGHVFDFRANAPQAFSASQKEEIAVHVILPHFHA
jgi:hypothetical protein|tara:strand:+ start:199 stop:336 length:138 start_codon:yes stop_codon:yes gene_type:complete